MPVFPESPASLAPRQLPRRRHGVTADASPSSPAGCCLVIIPVRNEAAAIGRVIAGCRRQGARVWVVDNGSTDGTPAVALAAGASRVLTCPSRLGGKTAALRFALQELAAMEDIPWICFMDGDGQHRPDDLPLLLAAGLDGADVVVGNRFPSAGRMPFARFWTNRLMSAFLNTICGGAAPDTQCGYRLLRREILTGWLPAGRHYEFETELYVHAVRRGAVVRSVPIPTIYAGERSKIVWLRDTLRFALCAARLLLAPARRVPRALPSSNGPGG
ncbi:hypothetical protein DB346_20165 [Verrucomicrobia bacterium LW23]|nr:hypothetical protein DB346_20165 [Verrucomicrobia bacterium LW23]